MPTEILGGGVQNKINAELQWPLVKGRGKSRIDDRFYAVPPADVGEAIEVKDVVVWVGRRLTN